MQISAHIALVFCLSVAAAGLQAAAAQTATQTTASTSNQTSSPAPAPPVIVHTVYPTGADSPLGAQIAALLADPSVSRAHWGIAVTTLDGTPLYGHDEGELFRPASNNKIFTTATAMALLGPAKTFDTRIFGKLDAATGEVTGDLTLVGGGDANFGADDLPYVPRSERAASSATASQPPPAPQPPGLADLASLADQLVAKGIKRITGEIVGDDTLYPYEPYAESWAQDDQVWGYGAPVSALSINNNQLELIVTPLAVQPSADGGRFVNATVQQNVPYYKVHSELQTVPAGTHADGIHIERLPGSRVIRIYGSMATDAPPDVEEIAIADPAEYAATALRAMLVQRGISVSGIARARHQPQRDGRDYLSQLLAPGDCVARVLDGGACALSCITGTKSETVLASHTSAPLSEDVVLTNKVSQNLHAELLLHQLGLIPCRPGSTLTGALTVRAYLLHAGLDPDDFLFFDGSGLSDHDLVAPRATATFLAYAAKQPWFAQWKASLPDAGEEGTLRGRFPDPPVKDHLFAKTGTLGESRALSGYLDAASGRTIIFSIFVDNHTPATSADRVTMDKIVTAIAAAE
jgi:D-alanyl-D-alanine carboxypeptidase/D-alanyl-D-alanine-endopeptidase (penicillin-binding protein 4)